jgi:phosphoesterase RecJ-like protein
MTGTINRISNVLSSIKRVVIVSHLDPDGDAIGSQVALLRGLRKIGIDAIILSDGNIPENLKFLIDEGETTDDISNYDYDAIFILDCGDIKRVPEEVVKKLDLKKITINIDHHKSNDKFAKINLILPHISSTCEIILNLLDSIGVQLTFDIALPLYVGLVMDTGNFTYSNTTPQSHRNAARLLTAGVDPYIVKRVLNRLESPSILRLLSDSLKSIELKFNGKLALMYLKKKMLERNGVKLEEVEGFVEFPRLIKGVEVAVFIVEINDKKTKVNFRSHGSIDVDDIADEFGGGGHKSAAGCIIPSNIKESENVLLKTIEKHLKEKGFV